MKKYFYVLTTVAILVFFDQLSKWWIRKSFELYESKSLTSFLAITFTTNTGVAFGMFEGYNSVMVIMVIMILIVIIFSFKNIETEFGIIGTGAMILIISGGIGNLVDRIFFGKVTDFIDLQWNYKNIWPVFNFADSYTFIGVWTLIFKSMFNKIKSHKS